MSDPAREAAHAAQLLRERRYEEAWPLRESRLADPAHDRMPVTSPAPPWQGEDPAGLRIAVCGEQGFGDQLMFGRWLPVLAARGAEVLVVCHPALERLFALLGYATAAARTDRPLPDCDAWAYFESLPHLLKAPLPPPAHYLPMHPDGGAGLGVVTYGSRTNANDANRSLPPAAAARLTTLGRDVSQEATGAYEFITSAHILLGLGRLVTVDTSMAHLAGALGVPLTVLLPQVGLDWRWNDGVRSDWYPDARLLRQTRAGDWDEVLDRIG